MCYEHLQGNDACTFQNSSYLVEEECGVWADIPETIIILFFLKRESFDAYMAKWYQLLNLSGESMDCVIYYFLQVLYIWNIFN